MYVYEKVNHLNVELMSITNNNELLDETMEHDYSMNTHLNANKINKKYQLNKDK